MLLFRILVGTFGMSIQFYAMSNMVLTDATVIMFTSPIVTFLLVSRVVIPYCQPPFNNTALLGVNNRERCC